MHPDDAERLLQAFQDGKLNDLGALKIRDVNIGDNTVRESNWLDEEVKRDKGTKRRDDSPGP